ncbi:MAG TPA: hypothetical protein VGM88_32875 [Kofleriaceae bacterium]|jgi:hypothetical protein
MKLSTTAALAGVLVSAGLGAARADDTPPPATTPSTDDAPAKPADPMTSDQLVLPKGKLAINAELGINLSKDGVGKPVSFSPDVWYGVTDMITLGLVHSYTGTTGFLGGVGTSLCLGSTDNGCARVYNNLGIDARIRLARPLSADVGIYVPNITDKFQLAVKLGLSGRYRFGALAIEAQPNIIIGLAGRPSDDDTDGQAVVVPSASAVLFGENTEILNVPVTLSYDVAPKFDVALQTGIALPFTHAGDTWRVPLTIGARYAVSPHLGVGLTFSFLDLIGGGEDTGIDARTIVLGGSYAL